MNSPIFELVGRIIKGNDWCRVAWQRCCDTPYSDETEWRRQLEMFHAGIKRLYILCLQLEASGYEQCLYNTPLCLGTTEITCWACPVTDRSTLGRPLAMPLDVLATMVGGSTIASRDAVNQIDRVSGTGRVNGYTHK